MAKSNHLTSLPFEGLTDAANDPQELSYACIIVFLFHVFSTCCVLQNVIAELFCVIL